MQAYKGFSKEELLKRKNELSLKYESYKKQGLKLDMSRGKPCTEQLDLSNGLFSHTNDLFTEDGFDCRNYGQFDGIKEVKDLFAELFDISTEELFIGGNSSLNLMYDLIAKAFNHGLNGFEKPWSKLDKVKFLCPCPGYDRHFAITELFGVEMIIVPIKEYGPDIDMIEALVSEDESIKGMWSIPMYSNPTGITYSDDVVQRLASMKTKASDFRIIWDNAYALHHLYDTPDKLADIISLCRESGNPDRVYMFGSTSKVTFPGAGIAFMASSRENIEHIKKQISKQTIGYNKVNMLLHARFLKNVENISEHMKKHAEILRPKFEAVHEILEKNLSGKDVASWNKPNGGYFISLDVYEGCAGKTVKLAKEAGVTFTPAGATFPYGKDPKDSNIRIAPTYPPVSELRTAIEVLCVCVELAVLDLILA
ncbi:MAG: aminotransferase class I/II-fold pyridoxal phosphate-dependent enzyme [Clostridiaceae bacterium]|jgi:DNA-binding transcriptional MocR family regulator|nr:aminotransferase class I/II-fold pyridoxal phosphate-dependent enzyme [Clostridiaceae bacterium]